MNYAIKLSKENLIKNEGGPFGACIVKDNIIIGCGHNEVIKNNDPTSHAEIVAIRNACNNLKTHDLSECVLYTSCYPCPMCLSAIMWANIKTVYYANTKYDAENIGFRDNFIYENIIDIVNNKKEIKGMSLIQINRDEAIKVFDEYLTKQDKTFY